MRVNESMADSYAVMQCYGSGKDCHCAVRYVMGNCHCVAMFVWMSIPLYYQLLFAILLLRKNNNMSGGCMNIDWGNLTKWTRQFVAVSYQWMSRCGVAIFTFACIAPYGATAKSLAPDSVPDAPPLILEMLQKSNLPPDSLGLAVIRVADGKLMMAQSVTRPMQPASTMKTVTAIVGLERLGPAWRARTELVSTAPIEKGVLNGDLLLRGLGNTDFEWRDFADMLQSLKNQGVSQIAGNLIVDRTFFNPARIDIGVPPFDESPEFRYNVIPDALLLNTNLVRYDIVTDNESFQIRMTPSLAGVTVISNMTFADRPCKRWEDGWIIPTTVKAANGDIRVYFNGTFPKSCRQAVTINVVDRADYVDRLFRAEWGKIDGSFAGVVIEAKMPEKAIGAGTSPIAYSKDNTRFYAEHQARALAEVMRNVNKSSDNPITRMAFLALGTLPNVTANSEATTLQRAEAEVRAWMKSHNIDDTGLVLDNGSGLSRSERISPLQLASVLRAAHGSKWAPEFLSSLPIVGVDGSMRNRLKDGKAAEVARIKTGSLRNVVSVAGYVPNARGEVFAVVAMINHDRAISAGGRPILDALLEWIAKSP
jgi:serine-type D-Ala-D-Ala carboxypeptidase/endopeptidase (penicillin-binding protein 4)